MLGVMVLATPVLAATTVSFLPTSINVKPGQNFNVSIAINPQGTNNYVEKVELKYPADMLQVNSFSFGNTWMALAQPGYDLIDNIKGVLVKSAGYPGGLSSATTFGTVSFYAKKSGSGTITIGNNSLAFEIGSQSALSGTPVLFTISVPAVAVPKPSTTKNPAITPSTNEQSTNITPVKQPVAQTATQNSLVATIGDFLTFGTGNMWIGLAVILVLVIMIYLIYLFLQRKRKNSGQM